MFYPQVLTSRWYREDVLKTIPKSIEGMGNWFAGNIQDTRDREAYLEVIGWCVSYCQHQDSVPKMMEYLLMVKENLQTKQEVRRHPFERWNKFTHSTEYKLSAINQVIELVGGIQDRYLTSPDSFFFN